MPTREELIKRQEQDTGHPNTPVFYIPKKKWVRDDKSRGEMYHADPDCHYLGQASQSPRETTRVEAKERWLAPCQKCVLGSQSHRNMDGTRREYDDDLLNELADDR